MILDCVKKTAETNLHNSGLLLKKIINILFSYWSKFSKLIQNINDEDGFAYLQLCIGLF